MLNQQLMERRQVIAVRVGGQNPALFVDHAGNSERRAVNGCRYSDCAGLLAGTGVLSRWPEKAGVRRGGVEPEILQVMACFKSGQRNK